jgi:bacillithiol system protein YtxJ
MSPEVIPIPDVAALDRLLAGSHAAPVLLVNHDPDCALSWTACGELGGLSAEAVSEVAIVDVRRARDVTRAIERRLGVPHESPQVIVVRDGRAAWSAAHAAIRAAAVERALREAAGPVPPV